MAAKQNLRWVVGVHACLEALKHSPQSVKGIYFLDPNQAKSDPWVAPLAKTRLKPQQKSVNFFRDLSEFGHQGVALATEHTPEWTGGTDEKSHLLFLDGIEDPHNLGAILRTSWLMEVDGIHITDRHAVKLTPTVCKVASGGAEHIPVTEANFQPELKRLKDEGYWIYGFSDEAKQSLYDIDFPEKVALVFGNEEKGVRLPVKNTCDELLSIPQASVGASYNVSVSVAIVLAELNRQRRAKPATNS